MNKVANFTDEFYLPIKTSLELRLPSYSTESSLASRIRLSDSTYVGFGPRFGRFLVGDSSD